MSKSDQKPYILSSSSDKADLAPIDPKATLMTAQEQMRCHDPSILEKIRKGEVVIVTEEQRNEFNATQKALQQQEQDATSQRLQNDIKAAIGDEN